MAALCVQDKYMLIEQPPQLYRSLYKGALWRKPIKDEKAVYLTFDDGPIPKITPWVLEMLEKHNVKATFFCVGDNVRKYPDIYKEILEGGHQVGNHTHNHVQGIRRFTKSYLANTQLASEYITSNLFRPPHGHMRLPQYYYLKKHYQIVMWDVVTRDYSNRMLPDDVLSIVKKYTRDGSIIVFHDSEKAELNMKYALPKSIEWLKKEGYSFKLL